MFDKIMPNGAAQISTKCENARALGTHSHRSRQHTVRRAMPVHRAAERRQLPGPYLLGTRSLEGIIE